MKTALPFQKCIVPACAGCERIETMLWHVTGGQIRVCNTYPTPAYWWRRGYCPFKPPVTVVKPKHVRVGQQKYRRKGKKL